MFTDIANFFPKYCYLGGLEKFSIPFAPLAVVPQRQKIPSFLPSPLVFLSISTDFTPTPTVPKAPKYFNSCSITPLPKVELWYLKCNLQKRLRNALRPINPDNACTLCITAAAGLLLWDIYSDFIVKYRINKWFNYINKFIHTLRPYIKSWINFSSHFSLIDRRFNTEILIKNFA